MTFKLKRLAAASGALPHVHSQNHMLLMALGLVFGDIGTSPLYAYQLTLKAVGHSTPTYADAMGVASLIIWSLVFAILIKYCVIVLRADNHGEGGILALASLVDTNRRNRFRVFGLGLTTVIGIVGSALLFGDGVITPAISVLSAMEGMKVLTSDFETLVVPVTILLLVLLFLAQRFGSGKIGGAFGPIMLSWFAVIALIGASRIFVTPGVLAALSPSFAYNLLSQNPGSAGAIFGAVFLAVTGGEAMYADMGHVGRRAIRRAFVFVVFPSLLLSYLGQAALVISSPQAADNCFYKAAPDWALVPLIFLAGAAAIIASQALISGVFSLTRQAIQFDLLPKMVVKQTSNHEFGQIYVPAMNWLLAAGTLLVVVGFKSSDALGAAYGIAVSGTMLLTTLLLAKVMTAKWRWSPMFAALVLGFFVPVDVGFFYSNFLKVLEGGWLPLFIAAVASFVMISWRLGTLAVRREISLMSLPLGAFIDKINEEAIVRVSGMAVWLTKRSDSETVMVSPVLRQHIYHNQSLHEHVLLLSVETARVPKVVGPSRFEFQELGEGFYRLQYNVGFMQPADVHAAVVAELHMLQREGFFPADLEKELHIFLGKESLQRKVRGSAMSSFTWSTFLFLKKFAAGATDFFKLPVEKVEEVGILVRI
jgi:KUP system potassium uptake protein